MISTGFDHAQLGTITVAGYYRNLFYLPSEWGIANLLTVCVNSTMCETVGGNSSMSLAPELAATFGETLNLTSRINTCQQ